MGPQANWMELAPTRDAQSCSAVIYPRSMMPNWRELKPSIIFLFDNVAKTYNELKSRGVNFVEEPKKMAGGTYAKFIDIDGNEFLIKA